MVSGTRTWRAVVVQQIESGVGKLSTADRLTAAQTLGDGMIPHVSLLPDALRVLVESAYGSGVGTVFLIGVPLAAITLVMVALLPNTPLGTMNGIDLAREKATAHSRLVEDAEDTLIEVSGASVALPPVGQAHPTGSIQVIEAPKTEARVSNRRS